ASPFPIPGFTIDSLSMQLAMVKCRSATMAQPSVACLLVRLLSGVHHLMEHPRHSVLPQHRIRRLVTGYNWNADSYRVDFFSQTGLCRAGHFEQAGGYYWDVDFFLVCESIT